MDYIITSDRIGLRAWQDSDLNVLASINADPVVMEHFPSTQSEEKTKAFIQRMKLLISEKGYCFFAADELSSGTLMGFIGIAAIPYEASFTPGVEIGWRLGPQYWGKGYATEGAKMCLDYAKDVLHIETIYSIAPIVNTKSIQVMEKIGMNRKLEFDHPLLGDYPSLERCVCYEV